MPVRPTLIPSDQDGAKPRRAAAFSSSIKCEHVIEKREKKQSPAPAFGSASLDRMMSQIEENWEENAPQPAAPALKSAALDRTMAQIEENVPQPEPKVAFSDAALDRMMSQMAENLM